MSAHMDTRDPIMLVLPRSEIESLNLRPFLRRFGLGVLPCGVELAALMGRCDFMVHGYDDEPEEIYAIEDIRRFYRLLWKEWPYWLYFCDLRSEGLMMMTLCCLEQLSGVKKVGQPSAQVLLDPVELVRFVSGGFAPMNEMFERAGAPERAIYDRTRQIFEYFHLPADMPPFE